MRVRAVVLQPAPEPAAELLVDAQRLVALHPALLALLPNAARRQSARVSKTCARARRSGARIRFDAANAAAGRRIALAVPAP